MILALQKCNIHQFVLFCRSDKAKIRRRRTRKNRKGSGGRGRRRKTAERSVYSSLSTADIYKVGTRTINQNSGWSATLGGLLPPSFSSPEDGHLQHRWRLHSDLCHHRLVDECTWPQCNAKCPRLRNPFTGEELEFTDLLRSFGLDINNVASILGIRVSQLGDMSHDALLQILNSQYYPATNGGDVHSSTHSVHHTK